MAGDDATTPARLGTAPTSVPAPRPSPQDEGTRHEAPALARLRLDDLRTGESPRRGGLHDQHVAALVAAGTWPPIVVHRSTLTVVDGAHRLAAARLLGLADVEVAYFDGPADAIFLEAVTRNVVRGLALSSADRRSAVLRILADHPSLSNRAIAQRVGVRAGTVADLRGKTGDPYGSRLGRDGRRYPLDRTQRRSLAEDYLATHPDATLKEVAGAGGIAISTAKNIRDRARAAQRSHWSHERVCDTSTTEEPERGSTFDQRSTIDELRTLLGVLSADPAFRGHQGGRQLLQALRPALDLPALIAKALDDIPAHQLHNAARAVDMYARLLHNATRDLSPDRTL